MRLIIDKEKLKQIVSDIFFLYQGYKKGRKHRPVQLSCYYCCHHLPPLVRYTCCRP